MSVNQKFTVILHPIMYKMIVLDLDGTLTNGEKRITKRTFDALMAAQKQGCRVVLASGRPTYGIMPLAEELQLSAYGGFIMAFNGGKIIDCTTGETLFEQKLDDELVPQIHDLALAADLQVLTYRGNAVVTTDASDEFVQHEAFINKMPVEQLDHFLDEIEYPVNKCLAVGEPSRVASFEPKIARLMAGRISVYTSQPFFLECMPLDIDKAASLGRLLSILGIGREKTIACGDGNNDVSMVQFAGLGVAMQNAEKAVKEVADYITLSNEEDGVGHVIEKFILKA
jgi:Cof subfamily protein (haloacid dehalogenase superfamily)